jgi:hypothetical protein
MIHDTRSLHRDVQTVSRFVVIKVTWEMHVRHLNLVPAPEDATLLRPTNLRIIADMSDRMEEPRP